MGQIVINNSAGDASPPAVPSPRFSFTISDDEPTDLASQQRSLEKQTRALDEAAQKLGEKKVAAAREKIAAAQAKIAAALKEKPTAEAIEALGKDTEELTDETQAIIRQDSHSHRSSGSGSSWDSGDALPIVAVVFLFGWLSIRAIVNGSTGRGAGRQAARMNAEDQATIAKLQRTLTQMESRVESLETILVETRRSKESYGTKF